MPEAPYYRDHLAFLLDGGQALARAFPRAADRLARRGFDPDVERILEGIAHISGKIDEKHDQSFPEISQLMFDVLFPHYLCPLPATTIVQLDGKPGLIPRGTALESVPVLGTSSQFRTTYDVELLPLHLTEVAWQGSARQAQLTLRLAGRWGADNPPDRLRLYLHGEPLLTRSLFEWLTTRLDGVELVDERGKSLASARGVTVRPLGYADDESLFPYPPGSFPGFRLLQEYFTLPQKFLFLDIEGLAHLLAQLPANESARFGLRFSLRVEAGHSFVVTQQNFRLGCTPVVNIFEHSADPVSRTAAQADYRIRPAGPHLHYQVYRVLEVLGRAPNGMITPYPLLSELDLETTDGAFCRLHRREVQGEVVSYLSLNDGRALPHAETILIDLLCSNGQIPLGLRVGDLCHVAAPFDERRCQILSPVTTPVGVPVGVDLRWRLVTHLSLSQRDLVSLDALRDAIALYNIHALRDTQVARALNLLLEGMLNAETRLVQHQHRRVPIWGQSTTLTLDESAFDTEGELYLFGCVLNEYVALQSQINTFSEFAIRRAKSQDVHRWPRRLGRHLLQSY